MPSRPPNIVLIMSDQHNPHILGCAGDPIVRTPNLDALSGRGVRFENLYCPYPLCVPSRMAFMAAQYPSPISSWDNGAMLGSDVPTFAHSLGVSGCEAVLCGRMHFVGPDQSHGFERRIHGDAWGWLTPEIRGSGDRRTTGQRRYAVEVSGHGRAGYEAYDESVTRAACEFIGSRAADERPYCLVVGWMLPHNPLICERSLFEEYMDALGPYEPPSEEAVARLHPAMRIWRERRQADRIDPECARRGRAAYYGLATTLDRNVGRILEAIDAASDAENTVVIYTSDHGDMAGEQGLWWKSSFYDGAARVPCIASWPGRFPAGREVREVTSLIDVAPTVLELAGAEPLPDATGLSLARFLRGEPAPDWPNQAFCEYAGLQGDQPSCMIRRGPWKLNYYSEFGSHQLFNLDQDPWELNDLRDAPAHRDVAADLLDRILSWWSADAMREGQEQQQRARRFTRPSSGGRRSEPPPGANEFDFSQLREGWGA